MQNAKCRMQNIKAIILSLCIATVALLMGVGPQSAFAANTLEMESYYYDLGSIEPGMSGFQYPAGRVAEIGVTCNLDTAPWELRVVLPANFNSGVNNFPSAKNIKLKVFYIGHSHDNNPDDPDNDPYWDNNTVDYLTPAFAASEPVEYKDDGSGNGMVVCRFDTLPGGSNQVKIKLAITVQVPEGGHNIAGDYAGDITFKLSP